MSASDVNAFPWAAVVSGLVGIAGIGGTLLSAHLTSGAAEKRRLAEQRHEDHTRFHKERVEVYARFIAATKAYRESLLRARIPVLLREQNPFDNTPMPHEVRAALADAREALSLIASEEVAEVADRIFGAVTTLENSKMTDETFERRDQVALHGLVEFRAAARAELLPLKNK